MAFARRVKTRCLALGMHEFPWCYKNVEVIHKCDICTAPIWPLPGYICRTCNWEEDPWAIEWPADPYNANGISFHEAFVNWSRHKNIYGKESHFLEIISMLRDVDRGP